MDRTLVEAARSGDAAAFDALARDVADGLFAIAHRILRDTDRAEDAVQQTLVATWRDLPRLREVDRFDAWVHRLLIRACYSEIRTSRRWSAHVRVLSMEPPTPDATVDVIVRDALDRGFQRLPADHRAVLVLHHYLGLPMHEVADRLGIPLGTAKSRLHYATSELRAALEADARTTTPASRERLA